MIERAQVAKFLKLNGIEVDASPDEIKSVLLSAKWHEDDVETALTVLREDPKTKEEHIDTVHNVFSSDTKLKPETISSLLGIDVDVSASELSWVKRPGHHVTGGLILNILVTSLIISLFVIVVSMWVFKVGLFHQTVLM